MLTDNGVQFTFPPRYADGATARYVTHMFDMRCQENGVEYRLTKIKHPWTNDQVERMNRTIKEATAQRYHYDRHDQLEAHLADFITAYNYARQLKTLKGLTPYEYTCKCWTSQPERFKLNPLQQMPGLNSYDGDGFRRRNRQSRREASHSKQIQQSNPPQLQQTRLQRARRYRALFLSAQGFQACRNSLRQTCQKFLGCRPPRRHRRLLDQLSLIPNTAMSLIRPRRISYPIGTRLLESRLMCSGQRKAEPRTSK
ncbi:hypothetical protein M2222_009284 [Bradyrhizobium elkanii]|nr:hypothetical protein [Bradyrhizobium elkanii]MCS3566903.1 hypothetical protein [Bradyrhizobium elkanii]MCW2153803.1 hypothetical protein [Bradyrhizobium elkanii]MCW2380366.1 hypothetical protein [Bradyrhizobium elkanii]